MEADPASRSGIILVLPECPALEAGGDTRVQALADQLFIVHPEREMTCTKERRDSLP